MNLLEKKFTKIPGFSSFYKLLFNKSTVTFSPDDLYELLDTVGVEKSIDNLLKVLDNFSRISVKIPIICQKPKWYAIADQVRDLQITANAILIDRSVLRANVPRLGVSLTKKAKNSFRGQTEGQSFYTTLGFVPRELSHRERYDQLIAQIFISYLAVVSQNKSEKLIGEFCDALVSIRSLSSQKAIESLPCKILSPEDYLSELRALPGIKKLPTICAFLSAANTVMVTGTLAGLTQLLNAGGSDNGLNLVRTRSYDQGENQVDGREERHLLLDDLNPAPSGALYILTSSVKSQLGKIGSLNIARQISSTRAMENQLFETAWNTLNQWDIMVLLNYIFKVEENIDDENLAVKPTIGLMLFAGLSTHRISQLQVSYDDNYIEGTDCYFAKKKILRLVSSQPEYKTQLSEVAASQSCPRQRSIDLELPSSLVTIFDQFFSAGLFEINSLLFNQSPSQINASVTSVFSRLGRTYKTRLYLTRVQNHMPGVISRLRGSDLAVSSLMFGKELYLARTRIHYTAFDTDRIQYLYRQGCQQVLVQGGSSSLMEESFPASDYYLGAALRPKLDCVRSLIEKLHGFLESSTKRFKSIKDLADYHNAYTLYTWAMVSYSSGYRAVNIPYLCANWIDEITGFTVISDKDSADYYHSRLIWLPEICRIQLQHYRIHVQCILSLSSTKPPGKSGEFFFLSSEDGAFVYASRSQIEKQLKAYGFYLPANVQRHFLKSELQENGCSAEAIELFLGHWSIGQEGWVETSALNPADYRDETQQYLLPLMRRIGLVPIAGLKTSPTKIKLSGTICQHIAERKKTANRSLPAKIRSVYEQEPPAQVWFDGLGTLFKNQPFNKAFRIQQQIVLARMHSLLPALYRGEYGTVISDEEIDTLISRIKTNRAHPRLIYKRLIFLIDGLGRGREQLGWQINIPDRPIVYPKGRNRIRPQVMLRIKDYREVEKVFIADLETPSSGNPLVQLGQILVSAVLYGGINHHRWADAFVAGLEKQWIYQCQQMVWVDLWTTTRPESLQEQWLLQRNASDYRRWLADPLTQLLLMRWHKAESGVLLRGFKEQKGKILNGEEVYQCYAQYVAKEHGCTLPSLNHLLACGNAWTTVHLPPFLSAYLENRIASSSLPDPVWLRVNTGKHYPSGHRPRQSINLENQKNRVIRAGSDQFELIKKLRAEINVQSGNSSKEIIASIQLFVVGNNITIGSATYLLAEWAVQMFSVRQTTQERRQKAPEAVSTVVNYLGMFYRQLIDVAGDVNLLELDEEEFEFLFSVVLENLSASEGDLSQVEMQLELSKITHAVDRLNQFLAFLHIFHGCTELSIKFDGGRPCLHQGVQVRANVVTVPEFERLKKVVGWHGGDLNREQRIALIWAILAFRAGMRVSEIHGLWISDVQGEDMLEVLIQPHRGRRLKSSASQRRIPLHTLLPEDELLFVRQWHQFRTQELGAKLTSPLFTNGPMEPYPCSRSRILNLLSPAIKFVTGDQGAVFHTLRHSFASWMLISLLKRDDCALKKLPAFLDAADFTSSRREELKTKLMANETLGRKSLYLIASLLGHADTQTELTSYMHFCDWLCWHYLRHPDCAPPLSVSAMAQLIGCSHSNAYKVLKKDGHCLATIADSILVNDLEHPLEQHSSSVVQVKQQKKCVSNLSFDEQLRFVYQEVSVGIAWPKNVDEIKVISFWYDFLNSLPSRRTLPKTAKIMFDCYCKHDHTFVFEEIEHSKRTIELLTNLGATFNCRHYTSRWPNSEKEREVWEGKARESLTDEIRELLKIETSRLIIEEDCEFVSKEVRVLLKKKVAKLIAKKARELRAEEEHKLWAEKLGIAVGHGENACGRKTRYGIVRITVVDIPVKGLAIGCDSTVARLFATLLVLLAQR